MFPDFIPNDLIYFWVFFAILSVLPLIVALVAQSKDDRKEREKK